MTQDNPRRRSWQRKPPLTAEQEAPPHRRSTGRKRCGIRLRGSTFVTWEWTQWYETPKARQAALEDLVRKGEGGRVIGEVER